jgi:hypothetical protein
MPDARQIEEALVRLLQEPDGQVLHQVAITLLSRQFGGAVAPDAYFAAVDALAARGIVGRARGQGGKVFLLNPSIDGPEDSGSVSPWTEPSLMPCLDAYLQRQYWRSLDRPPNSLWLVIDTSLMRPNSGKWSHPDFAVVSITPLQILRTPVLDVYSFELKAEGAGNLVAVHEALAQTRQTHFGTLVWHLPPHSPYETRLPEVRDGCEEHGIGLILIRDPQNPETWDRAIEPERKKTPLADIDGFLAARLTDRQKEQLQSHLKGDA